MAEAQKVVQALLDFDSEAETLGEARGHQDKPGKNPVAATFKETSSGQHLSLSAGLSDRKIAEGDADGAFLQLRSERSVILGSDGEEAKEPGSISRSKFGQDSSPRELGSLSSQKRQKLCPEFRKRAVKPYGFGTSSRFSSW